MWKQKLGKPVLSHCEAPLTPLPVFAAHFLQTAFCCGRACGKVSGVGTPAARLREKDETPNSPPQSMLGSIPAAKEW